MSDRHVVVYIATNPRQAHLLRIVLAEAGIDSFVSNETLNAVHFAGGDWMVRAAGGPGFLPTSPTVVVHENNAVRAREILLAAEKQLQQRQPAPELVAPEAESGEEASWPLCPHCARPRLATCPVCKTSGADFPAAFFPEQEPGLEDASRLVICPTCDEAFAPRYPARCEWCGHRFADGYELPPRSTPTTITMWAVVAEQLTARAITLIAAIFLLGMALVGWFAYVLR